MEIKESNLHNSPSKFKWIYFFLFLQTLTMGLVISNLLSLINHARCYEPTTSCGSGVSRQLADSKEISIYIIWWIQISCIAFFGIYWLIKKYLISSRRRLISQPLTTNSMSIKETSILQPQPNNQPLVEEKQIHHTENTKLSDDGKWIWDGQKWSPYQNTMKSTTNFSKTKADLAFILSIISFFFFPISIISLILANRCLSITEQVPNHPEEKTAKTAKKLSIIVLSVWISLTIIVSLFFFALFIWANSLAV